MENIDTIGLLKDIVLVVTTVFSAYKLFFEKKKNDLGLDSSKINLLKEIQSLEENKVRRIIDDYNELEQKHQQMKTILETQGELIKKYERQIKYYEKKFKEHNISYDATF